jgi:hypothetical protein
VRRFPRKKKGAQLIVLADLPLLPDLLGPPSNGPFGKVGAPIRAYPGIVALAELYDIDAIHPG